MKACVVSIKSRNPSFALTTVQAVHVLMAVHAEILLTATNVAVLKDNSPANNAIKVSINWFRNQYVTDRCCTMMSVFTFF